MVNSCWKFFFTCKNKSESESENKVTYFQTFMNMASNSFQRNKNKIIDTCKICNKELKEDEVCHCLKNNIFPNKKEVSEKIKEEYIQKEAVIKEVIHIDKNPEKLTHFVNGIYDIVEKTSLKEDLSPKSMEKVKENLVNEICIHLEEYII